MYIRRKVYSYSEPEEQLYSVTMTEEELDLFSDFMNAYEEALYSELSSDEKAAAAAGALGAATVAGVGAYKGHQAIKNRGGYKKSAQDAWGYTKDKAKSAKDYAKDKGTKAWDSTKSAGRYVKDQATKGYAGTKNLWKNGGKTGKAAIVGGGVALGAGAYGAGKAVYNRIKKD